MTEYDDLPIEVRRLNWGWFGEPWPSGICYVDGRPGEVNWDMEKPTPVGEQCLWCDEEFVPGDQGTAMPYSTKEGLQIRHQHKECGLRQVVGSYAHLTSTCRGDGRCNHIDTGMTKREDALAVWEWTRRNGYR